MGSCTCASVPACTWPSQQPCRWPAHASCLRGTTAAGAPCKLGVACSFDGWRSLAWKTASYFPGITLFTLTTLNILIHHTGSSGAIPLGAFFSLIALWFIISIPLCFSGAERSPGRPCNAGGTARE